MERLTKYSNDIIRNKAINIIRKLSDRNGLNGDELAVVSAFCLIERTENKALKEYEDLEEQGKLMKLRCAVGDTVYTLNPLPAGKTAIGETTADAFMCALGMLESRFGKTIFLSLEEAEAALKEMSE